MRRPFHLSRWILVRTISPNADRALTACPGGKRPLCHNNPRLKVESYVLPRVRSYSVALIGLGHRGYKSHSQSWFNDLSNSIVAVCDTDRGILNTFSDNHPDVPAYLSLAQLLREHAPDFAILSVPHGFHMDCVMALSEKGVPVLKEKPVVECMNEFVQ